MPKQDGTLNKVLYGIKGVEDGNIVIAAKVNVDEAKEGVEVKTIVMEAKGFMIAK